MIESKAPRILVIDDESTHRILAKDYLEAAGYVVRMAEDGKRGLKLASAWKPHLVLVDLMIPGIDGYELCKTLKSMPETADVPTILITASREADVIARGVAAGVDDFVTKPVDWAYLADRVSLVLSKFEDRQRVLVEKDEMSRLLQVVRKQDSVDPVQASMGDMDLPEGEGARAEETDAQIQAIRQSAEIEMQALEARLHAQMEAQRVEMLTTIEAEREAAHREIDAIGRALLEARSEHANALATLRDQTATEVETLTRSVKQQLEAERRRVSELKEGQEATVQAAVRAVLDKAPVAQAAVSQQFQKKIESPRSATEHQLQIIGADLREQTKDEQLALEARTRAGWDTMRASGYRNASSVQQILEKLRAVILAAGSPGGDRQFVSKLQEIEGLAKAHSTSIANQQLLSHIMSGQSSNRETVFDLVTVVQSSVEKAKSFADRRKVALSSSLPRHSIRFVGDEQLIDYAIVGLIVNAIQHSPHGATVNLSLADGGAEGVDVKIVDAGVGIPPARLDALRGCLDRPTGPIGDEKIGYGIPLASAILRLHNAGFELNSRIGSGTVAHICLPPERLAHNVPAKGHG